MGPEADPREHQSASAGTPAPLPDAAAPPHGPDPTAPAPAPLPDAEAPLPAASAPIALEEAEQHRRFAFGLERLVFFSDAVMAIAITLLVIDVRLPVITEPATSEAILAAFRDVVPDLFAFTISFVVIAAFWLGHYRAFRWIARLDGRLIGINFVFLFLIALLPFPTSVVASHGAKTASVVFYAAIVMAGGLASSLLWIYPMLITDLGVASVTREIARRVAWRTLAVPVVFALSIPVAFVNPTLAELLWVLAIPAQAVISRRLHLSLTLG
jgi:uncharacterized membrane protein